MVCTHPRSLQIRLEMLGIKQRMGELRGLHGRATLSRFDDTNDDEVQVRVHAGRHRRAGGAFVRARDAAFCAVPLPNAAAHAAAWDACAARASRCRLPH